MWIVYIGVEGMFVFVFYKRNVNLMVFLLEKKSEKFMIYFLCRERKKLENFQKMIIRRRYFNMIRIFSGFFV